MSDEEFDEMCFTFGIELDEVTSERIMFEKEKGSAGASAALSEEVLYRIDIPANRYDLLTMEGLVRALKAFLAIGPKQKPITVKKGEIEITCTAAARKERPFLKAAVIRGIHMTPSLYESLIELQDKLHSGIGRRRTILSMGTYDLDKIITSAAAAINDVPALEMSPKTRFVFDALPPTSFTFVPLNRKEGGKVDGLGLIKQLEDGLDTKMKKYATLLKGHTHFPVLSHSSTGQILSVPPLINGDLSKIDLNTKDMLIDVTGFDENKVNVVLNCLVTSIRSSSSYVESVDVINIEDDNNNNSNSTTVAKSSTVTSPDLSIREKIISLQYINQILGLSLGQGEVVALLEKMMIAACPSGVKDVLVMIPPHRSDIIHACDIMEDVGIAYGFNNLTPTLPPTNTIASRDPLNQLSDLVRREVALAGWMEIVTFTLCSWKENFTYLRKEDPGNEAVLLDRPKTLDFEVVHSSLIPSMLKTVSSNKSHPLPLKLFQVADVVLQDPSTDTGARNERRLCVLHCGMSSGLDLVHGLLDRVMRMFNVPFGTYTIEASNNPTLFPGRQASIHYGGKKLGYFGIVDPAVSSSFDAPFVSSVLELNIEPLL